MVDHEVPIVFDCCGDQLIGILHVAKPTAKSAVIIVVGGPQYRVGSHREFVLMARHLAAHGVPVFRFDVRGMGDSSGNKCGFEKIDEDIHAAIDCLTEQLPSVENIFLLGLCDAASSALMYAPDDDRVIGLMLVNPWVRTRPDRIRYPLRHYYLPRLLQGSLWRKGLSGQITLARSLTELLGALKAAMSTVSRDLRGMSNPEGAFVDHMLTGLESFSGPILLLISGDDLTGREFLELSKADRRWRRAVKRARMTIKLFPNADHTMSDREDLELAVTECLAWHARVSQDPAQQRSLGADQLSDS